MTISSLQIIGQIVGQLGFLRGVRCSVFGGCARRGGLSAGAERAEQKGGGHQNGKNAMHFHKRILPFIMIAVFRE